MASTFTPPRERAVKAFPPGWPLPSPSISRPKLSIRPEGGTPSTWSWAGLESENGFVGVSVTVLLAAS